MIRKGKGKNRNPNPISKFKNSCPRTENRCCVCTKIQPNRVRSGRGRKLDDFDRCFHPWRTRGFISRRVRTRVAGYSALSYDQNEKQTLVTRVTRHWLLKISSSRASRLKIDWNSKLVLRAIAHVSGIVADSTLSVNSS